MDLTQLIMGFIAKALDQLKASNRIVWLVLGAIVIAAESFFTGPASPVQLPAGVITGLTTLALAFLNPRTSLKVAAINQGDLKSPAPNLYNSTGIGTPGATLGERFDALLAKLADTLKVKSPMVYLILISILGAAKFVLTEGGLQMDEQVMVIVLSFVQFFTAPRTSQYVAPVVGTTPVAIPSTATNPIAYDKADDGGDDIAQGEWRQP